MSAVIVGRTKRGESRCSRGAFALVKLKWWCPNVNSRGKTLNERQKSEPRRDRFGGCEARVIGGRRMSPCYRY